jgi:hypothetical protein
MKKLIILAISVVLILGLGSAYGQVKQDQKPKVITKNNVPPENADKETASIIISLGFTSPAIGNDPCQGAQKPMGGIKKYSSTNISLGKLPGEPSVSVGKSGQAMEGEVDRKKEEQEIIKEMDSAMDNFLHNNNEEAMKHLEKAREINDDRTRRDMEAVKNSENPTKEQLNNLVEDIQTGWVIGRNDDNLDRQAWQEFAKGAVRSAEYPEDRKEWIKKSIYTPNPEIVSCDSPVCKKADELRRKYQKELEASIQKGKEGKVGKQEQTGGRTSRKGMQPAKTYPGESIKSGYEKEKESKIDKGGLVTNPTGEGGRFSSRGFDLCGRHLPSPEEFAKMKLDPGHIVDPVDRTWTGRIEQVEQERSLVWSKSVINRDGSSVRVERRYTNGNLSSISYTFYDKNGKQIGSVNYNARDKSIKGERK